MAAAAASTSNAENKIGRFTFSLEEHRETRRLHAQRFRFRVQFVGQEIPDQMDQAMKELVEEMNAQHLQLKPDDFLGVELEPNSARDGYAVFLPYRMFRLFDPSEVLRTIERSAQSNSSLFDLGKPFDFVVSTVENRNPESLAGSFLHRNS